MDDFVFRTKKTFRSVVSVEQTTSAVGVDSNRYVNFETNLPKKSTIIHFTGCVDRNRSRDLKKKNKKKKRSWSWPKVMIIFIFCILPFPFRLIIYSFYPARHSFFLPSVPAGYETTRKALRRTCCRFWVRWEGQNSPRRLDITRHSLHVVVKSSACFLWEPIFIWLDLIELDEGGGGQLKTFGCIIRQFSWIVECYRLVPFHQ